ncbi:MAG: CoA transferase, partial [Chloroflexi bacterium]|nr:CoA transferase [Chloroflexota bacterium]
MEAQTAAARPRQILDGVRIADFTWWGAGPIASKWLGAHGAQVIKIESAVYLDSLRGNEPMPPGRTGLNVSGFYNNFNSDKLDVTLNLNKPEAIAIAKRIIAISDIVLDNFTPHSMERWGLTYDELRKINPALIVAAQPMQGMTGPQRDATGSGATLQAVTGMHGLIGWPDLPPTGTGTAYPDYASNPHHWLLYVLSAFRHRMRTGSGQYIDQSQLQSTVSFIGPAVLDYTANGRVQTAQGNRSPNAAPRGAYPCRPEPGDWEMTIRPADEYDAAADRWVAIEVSDDAEWAGLGRAAGDPEWSRDPRFATARGRHEHAEELDRLIGGWTQGLAAREAMERLQEEGVPSGVVQSSADLLTRDPQIAARGHYYLKDHAEAGPHHYDGPPFRLSRTPGAIHRPAPMMGEHNRFVL